MVDLGLMRALVDALAPETTLVLVGDPDQLVSVSAGSVLADIVAAAEAGALPGHHVRLDHIWRARDASARSTRRCGGATPKVCWASGCRLPLVRHRCPRPTPRCNCGGSRPGWPLRSGTRSTRCADDPATLRTSSSPTAPTATADRPAQRTLGLRRDQRSDRPAHAPPPRRHRLASRPPGHRPPQRLHPPRLQRRCRHHRADREVVRVCFEHTDSEGRVDYRWLLPRAGTARARPRLRADDPQEPGLRIPPRRPAAPTRRQQPHPVPATPLHRRFAGHKGAPTSIPPCRARSPGDEGTSTEKRSLAAGFPTHCRPRHRCGSALDA
jgi:hypothetical protein